MSIISHGGKDYDVPAYSVQDDSSATSLDSSKVPTGGTVLAVYGDPDTYMIKGTDYVTAGKKANTTLGANATAEGLDTTASSAQAHAEGKSTVASGSYSHAEGEGCTANGLYAHAEGWHTTAGSGCHAEGSGSTASASYSHAEGVSTTASEEGAHAEGYSSQATKKGSHSENRAYAQGEFSHAEGLFSKTKAAQAHAEGASTLASSENQHVQGKYNIEDANGIYAHIVGNGTNSSNRSNAHTLDWSGNAWFAGDVTDGSGNVLSDKADTADISGAKSISGNPIIIEDSANAYAEEVIANIEPIQDLHGYDHPWVGGAGKNKQILTVEGIISSNGGTWSGNTYTLNNVTFTILTDDDNNVIGIKTNGTANANILFYFPLVNLNGAYIINGCPIGGSVESYRLDLRTWDGGVSVIDIGDGATTPALQSASMMCVIRVGNGTVCNNIIFHPMIRLATETDPTFEPYSNICPISGLDSVEVKRIGKNKLVYPYKDNGGTSGGVTYTFNTDGSVSLSGTATTSYTEWLAFNRNYYPLSLKAGQYILSGGYSSDITVVVGHTNSSTSAWEILATSTGGDIPFELTYDDDKIGVTISTTKNGLNVDGITLYPMIRLATETDSTFEPYQSETHTTSLPQTTYGGTLNVQTGELVVDRGYYKFDGSETWGKFNKGWGTTKLDGIIKSNINNATIANIISDIYIAITPNGSWSGSQGAGITVTIPSDNAKIRFYDSDLVDSNVSAVASHMSGHSICYELATPQTYYLTPEQVKLLKGYNHITTNADTLDIIYQVDNVLGEVLSESEGYTDRVLDDLGTASKKDIETTLTNDENLPTGSAVISYLNSNFVQFEEVSDLNKPLTDNVITSLCMYRSSAANKPTGNAGVVLTYVPSANSYSAQFAFELSGQIWYRLRNGSGTISAWAQKV